ncbi:MAG: hypothetical protein ACI9C1_002332 [Candidatus Aldehydirespiratoraceae bacterium]|jgi:hypothetical protein
MNTEKTLKKAAEFVAAGEAVLAAVKVIPRGAAHATILGAAGAVAVGVVGPALTGAGAVLGSAAAEGSGVAGQAERADADLDVGSAPQAPLIESISSGEARLFGQKLMEIMITTTSGGEAGFGVAKVHRKHGDAVVEMLTAGNDSI